MSNNNTNWRPSRMVWLVIFFAFTTFFVHNSVLQPDIMECRNLITAHEMATDGNWMVPTMNGEIRLEKPPLPTWVGGVIDTIAPLNLHYQRAAAGAMAMLWTFFFWLFVRRTTGDERLANVAALLFVTCYNIILQGRTASWDIYCHAFMMAAIYFLYCSLYEQEHIWANFAWAGIFMGLSFMSKGPVSFYALLLPFLIASLITRRPQMQGKWGAFMLMVVLALVIGLWWYVYVLISEPQTAQAVWSQESTSWVSHNTRPWYYYWRFFLETGIWAPLMLIAIFVAIRMAVKKTLHKNTSLWFATIWALATLVVLSLMPEKKMRYLVPLMPACCLMMTCVLAMMHRPRHGFALVYIVAVLFAIIEIFFIPYVPDMLGTTQRTRLSNIRHIELLKPMRWYCLRSQNHDFRIETVYEAAHKIKPIEKSDLDTIQKPYVLLTSAAMADSLKQGEQAGGYTVEHIGRYDDNKHPESDRHYTQSLINHVLVVRKQN